MHFEESYPSCAVLDTASFSNAFAAVIAADHGTGAVAGTEEAAVGMIEDTRHHHMVREAFRNFVGLRTSLESNQEPFLPAGTLYPSEYPTGATLKSLRTCTS